MTEKLNDSSKSEQITRVKSRKKQAEKKRCET